jgi:hypothetical protein
MCERVWTLPPAAKARPPAPSITHAEWRKRARERLAGPTSMREKAWLVKAGKDEETHRSRYGRSASTRAGRRVPSAKWPTLDFPMRAKNERFRAGTLRLTNTTFPRANGLVYDIGCGRYILLHILIIREFTLQALSLGL